MSSPATRSMDSSTPRTFLGLKALETIRRRRECLGLSVEIMPEKYSTISGGKSIIDTAPGPEIKTSGWRETSKALDQALGDLPAGVYPIHHSDRGCQYCSHEYVDQLRARGLGISMTEGDHCAENALAERVNGILKQEYGLGYGFKTKALARKAIPEAIYLYNTRRLHTALNYRIPQFVHAESMAA